MAIIWCDPDGDPDDIKLFQGPTGVTYSGPWSPGEDICYDSFQEALAAVASQTLSETPIPAWLVYQEPDAFELNHFGFGWTYHGPEPPMNFFDTFLDALEAVLNYWDGPGISEQPQYIFNGATQELQNEGRRILWRDPGSEISRFSIAYVGVGDPEYEAVIPLEEIQTTGDPPDDLQAWLLAHQTAINGGVIFGSDDITAIVAYGCGDCTCSDPPSVQPAPIVEDDFTAEAPALPAVDCLTRWAQCWCIKRRDGQVFHFTSHDQPVVFRGASYQPCHSLSASAAELGSLLGAPGNAELVGIIDDAAITEADLYAGLFDQACIEVWLVPWSGDESNCIPLSPLIRGITGDLSQGHKGFAMEVLTPGAQLQQQPLLELYTPGCRYRLGDARCGVDLDALAVNGEVTQVAIPDVASRAQYRVFFDSSRMEADGYFDLGVLEWTSGVNAGQISEIKSYTDDGRFVLWRPMPKPIELTDQYEARPGCDKLKPTCQTKFDNFDNYGGFPDVPGRDSIMQTPNSKG